MSDEWYHLRKRLLADTSVHLHAITILFHVQHVNNTAFVEAVSNPVSHTQFFFFKYFGVEACDLEDDFALLFLPHICASTASEPFLCSCVWSDD